MKIKSLKTELYEALQETQREIFNEFRVDCPQTPDAAKKFMNNARRFAARNAAYDFFENFFLKNFTTDQGKKSLLRPQALAAVNSAEKLEKFRHQVRTLWAKLWMSGNGPLGAKAKLYAEISAEFFAKARTTIIQTPAVIALGFAALAGIWQVAQSALRPQA